MRRRKEPTVVLVIVLLIQIALIGAFAFRGNVQVLEGYDWKHLAIIGMLLLFVYILYVELRVVRLGRTIVEEKIKTHTLVEALPQAVVVLDDEDRVVTSNPAACKILGIDPISSVGEAVASVLGEGVVEPLKVTGGARFDFTSRSGEPLRISSLPLRDGAGKLLMIGPPGTSTVVRRTSAGSDGPQRLWKLLAPMSEQIDRLDDGLRASLTRALFQARKGMNAPQQAEGIPAKAASTKVDVGAVLREASARMEPLRRARRVEIEVKVNGDAMAGVDASLLGRALEEILINAVTYSQTGQKVLVDVDGTAASEVSIRVTDSGIGIDAGDLGRIFDPGFVGTRQLPEGEGGAGLGLALARRVMESHGGSIWAESQAGRGTRISLQLPRG